MDAAAALATGVRSPMGRRREGSSGTFKYLRYAPSAGLHYGSAPDDFGQWSQLKYKRDAGSIEVCSDASYEADYEEECKGMQSAHVFWGGALVMWGQCRQPLIPTSTAQAELIALAEAHLMGKAMSPAIEALLEGITSAPPNRVLYCDNSAAVQICLYDTGSWRTRHLRRRSASIHYDVEASEWKLSHLEGVFMTADIGTKALGPSRFDDLLQALELCTPHREFRTTAETESQSIKPEPTWVTKVLLALALLCQVQAASAQTTSTSNFPAVTGGSLFRICIWVSLTGLLLGFCGFFGWSLGKLVLAWFKPPPRTQTSEPPLLRTVQAIQEGSRSNGSASFRGRNSRLPNQVELAERYRQETEAAQLLEAYILEQSVDTAYFQATGHLQHRYPTVPTPGQGGPPVEEELVLQRVDWPQGAEEHGAGVFTSESSGESDTSTMSPYEGMPITPSSSAPSVRSVWHPQPQGRSRKWGKTM